jgi:hypothetical protein
MNPERPLVELARRFQTSCSGDPRRLREQLRATLEPMIRCALRTGLGQPPLVRWVQNQLPLLDRGGEDVAAPLAQALSERLMARLDPLPGRETVLGP